MGVGDEPTVAGSAPSVEMSLVTDALLAGRYRIVRWLGGGGMGGVYAAHDAELEVEVALKVLHPTTSAEAIERFRAEVRLTRQIQHRNVARMYDIGSHAGQRFLTMELIEGETLADELARGPLAWPRLRDVAEQICAGLAAAHAGGIVHRDLKPANVIVERATGRAVITDFGIARRTADAGVTQEGLVVGTPRYMAPEQLSGEEIDARTDLFSLGVMLFELATGTRPWAGNNAVAIAIAQYAAPAPPLTGMPPAVAGAIASCLSVDRGGRPASAEQVRAVLREGPSLEPVTVPERPTPRPHSARVVTVAVLPLRAPPADAYIAEGVFEDVLDTLALTPRLRVRPTGGVATSDDPVELGKRLEVDHVVVGSLRRTPGGLRIALRMTSVADGFQVWSRQIDTMEAEVLVAGHELARGIAAALSTQAASEQRPTDPRAVELFLRARAELRRFGGAHADAAYTLLAEAAALAPDSPQILGALAWAAVQAWIMKASPALAGRARDAVASALATDHGDAHLASAVLRLNSGDPVGGAADLALALARAPMSAQAHETCARILAEVGDLDSAYRRFATAAGLDVGRAPAIETELARLDAFRGDPASAAARIAAVSADPDTGVAVAGLVFGTRMFVWRGDLASAVASADRAIPLLADAARGMLVFVRESLARTSIDAQAWEVLVGLLLGADRPQRILLLMLQVLSEVAVSVGAIELGVSTIERAAQLGLIDINWLDRCPLFTGLHEHPHWAAVRAQVGARAAAVLAALSS